MATKVQWKQPDGNGNFEVIHHETSADVVRYSDTTVADVLDNTTILTASAFMESLLSAEDAFEARAILKVGRENFFDESGKRWSNTSSLLSSEQKKFGESSMYLNGSANLRQVTGITLGGKDFSMALWFYVPSSGTTSRFFCGGDSSTRFLTGSDSGTLTWFWAYSGTTVFNNTTTSAIPTGVWNHLELDYRNSDNKLFLFLNGEKADEQVVSSLATPLTMPIYLGKHPTNDNYNFTGYIDEFIITEQLLHSADFTPPSAPYSFDSDTTVALLHFE